MRRRIESQYILKVPIMTMDSVRDLIIASSSIKNQSLTITEIDQRTDLNRHAIGRQLDIPELLGKVRKIQHGNAENYFLTASVPISGLVDISSDIIIIIDNDFQIGDRK